MSADRPTRRRILRGNAAAREAAAAAPFAPPAKPKTAPPVIGAAPPIEAEQSVMLASVRRRAMACDWEVQLAADRDDDSMEHIFAALDLVEALEDQLTVYRDDSEVIRINCQAANRPVPVEPRLFALLQLAARLHDETWGALDITSGPLSDAWGFSRRRGRIASEGEIHRALECVGMEYVTLDEANRTISFRRPGVAINFNCIGKGYALDRMAELLSDAAVDDFLLHGGKSSVLARGNRPGRHAGGWSIGLRHPLRPAERMAEFHLRDEALSTSGAATQFFRRRGRRYGHILDPRTGHPAEGIYSATVIAPTAAEADALSTAFYVMGPDKVAEYCAFRPQLAVLLVTPADRDGEIELHPIGLDKARWQRLR